MPKKIELGPMISSAGRQARPVVDVEDAGVPVDVERIDAVCWLEHATISPLIAIALMVVRNIALTAVLRMKVGCLSVERWTPDPHVWFQSRQSRVTSVARTLSIHDSTGCRGLLIHAESNEARALYLHLVSELEVSPTDDLHLVLLMQDARQTLRF